MAYSKTELFSTEYQEVLRAVKAFGASGTTGNT